MAKPSTVFKMDAKRKARRKETAEVFTPNALLDIMCAKLSPGVWEDPDKTFLDNCCGNGQIILYILNKKLDHGSTYLQALNTTYGLDIMEDNVEETRERIHELLKERNIEYNKEEVDTIINYTIQCSDAFKWDYENWCPKSEAKGTALF